MSQISSVSDVNRFYAGEKFGKWSVIERDGNKKIGGYWKCRCECGKIKTIFGSDLRRGKTKQCRSCSAIKRATKHERGKRKTLTLQKKALTEQKKRIKSTEGKH